MSSPPITVPDAEPQADLKTWLAVGGSMIGAFIAVLNIQITNASLPNIQGAIGAGIDDGGWISTAYLVAEIVVIPLTGFLAPVFSLRRYLLANTVLFLVMSVACAFAQNLTQMIVLRAMQGFFGGVLIPLAFTITLTMLPRAKQPIGLALFAVSATFAPAIGPTIGGYLTETYGWQYIFYVNMVPGAIMLATLWPTLRPSPMKLALLRNGDWAGIATLAIALSSLQTVLEEGNKDDWFGSPFILRLSIVATISFALFLWIELTSKAPLLNLRLLTRRNFGLGSVSNLILGMALYGSVYLLPVYLSQTKGYNAEQVGMVLAWTGLPQLVLIPFVPFLMRHIDARLMAAVGFALFALSCFLNLEISPDYAGDQLLIPNLVRALGQALVMTPLSAMATSGIERANAGSASAMFNMMRNLGGSVGIAALETFVTKREQFHSSVITANVSLLSAATRQRIASLQSYFLANGASNPATAWHEAVVQIGRTVRGQSYLLAYSDAFYLMGAALLLALVTSLGMRKSSGGGAGAH
jgi:MFS transporter, DHA2 family, multidrug resistance protein